MWVRVVVELVSPGIHWDYPSQVRARASFPSFMSLGQPAHVLGEGVGPVLSLEGSDLPLLQKASWG